MPVLEQVLKEPAFTIPAAAKEVGVSEPTLWGYLKAGRIRKVKVGGRTFIRLSELRKLVVEAE